MLAEWAQPPQLLQPSEYETKATGCSSPSSAQVESGPSSHLHDIVLIQAQEQFCCVFIYVLFVI
jgi:hypothetical protein